MSLADVAAKAVRGISKMGGAKLKRKMNAHPISNHLIKSIEGNGYKCGFASCEVMPDDLFSAPHYIAGHGPGHSVEAVHDPVTVNAMWIGCEDNGGFVIVSADCIGLTRVDVIKVRDMLTSFVKKTNCKSINICCTHSHAGFDTVGYWGKIPKTGKNEKYMDKLFKSIADIIQKAYDNRTDGKLYVGTVSVPEAQLDRREPIVLNDTLTRIRFVPNDGSNETWLLNYAAHPNTLGGANRTVSADYPFYLRDTIKKEKSVNILFGVGAIGAVDPGMFCEEKVERTRLQGECLGKAALTIDNDKELSAKVKILRQPFYVPVENSVLAFMASLKLMNSKRYPNEESSIGVALKTEITYIKLGELNILLLPGESFPETVYGGYASAEESATGSSDNINSRPLVDIAGDKNLLVFGVTNDMTGYVVPPNDFVLHKTQPYLSNGKDRFDRGHYHETNSLGINTSHKIAEVFETVVSRMNAEG